MLWPAGCLLASLLLPMQPPATAIYPEPTTIFSTCDVKNLGYTENFSPSHVDPAYSSPWYVNQLGYVALGFRAGGFADSPYAGSFKFPVYDYQRVYALVAGDFNSDGRDDLIVGVTTPGGASQLFFFANSASGLKTGSPLATGDARYNTVMAAGDVNGDGRMDFITAGMYSPFSFTVASATLYLNTTFGSVASFSPVDLGPTLARDNITWHVGGSQLAFADNNGDGYADLFALSSQSYSSEVRLYPSNAAANLTGPSTVLIADVGLAYPIASAGTVPPVGYACMPAIGTSVGGTVLIPTDLNSDGLLDLVVGSASESRLRRFEQTSTQTYDTLPDIQLAAGGPLFGASRDVDQDGFADLIYFRSGAHCGGEPGEAYVLFGNARQAYTSIGQHYPFGHSITFAAVLNYDGDAAKTVDFLAGRHNRIGKHSVYLNSQSKLVYNTAGITTSKAVAAVDPTTQGIVDATVRAWAPTKPGAPGDTNMLLQLSNDGGGHWEDLKGNELPPQAVAHTFSHFGSDLRWRILSTAKQAPLFGTDQIYAPGSYQTPRASSLSFSYSVVGPALFSRANAATLRLATTPAPVDLLYANFFSFPGNLGNLLAYNLSGAPPSAASSSRLEQINGNANTPLVWNAGDLLRGQSGSQRLLYLSEPQPPMIPIGPGIDTLTLPTQPQISSSASLPPLVSTSNAYAAALRVPLIGVDPVPVTATILDGFGEPQQWKLRDAGHASPVAVGPPSGDPCYLKNNYADYRSTQQGRASVVYQPANDGMLHAFDATNGSELWGLVPFNLFSTFLAQEKVNADGSMLYQHQPSLDATPTVGDIYAGGSWRTVLIGGEGQGIGLGNTGYIYAVDITSPTQPKPLWEFSDIRSQSTQTCDLSNTCSTECIPTCRDNPPTCYSECNTYDSFFDVVPPTTGLIYVGAFDDGLCQYYAAYGYVSCSGLEYPFLIHTEASYDVWLKTRPWPSDPYECVDSQLDYGATAQTYTYVNPTPVTIWVKMVTATLTPGEHVYIFSGCGWRGYHDFVAVLPAGSPAPPEKPDFFSEQTCIQACDQICTANCSTTCVDPTQDVPWPQCGAGANQQCCGTLGSDQYCAPVGQCGAAPEASTGQTSGTPAIGRLKSSSGGTWAVFFASGYNPGTAPSVGRRIYALDAYTGALIAKWEVGDIPGPNGANPSSIDNSLPGSPSLVDIDGDGFVDRAYIGDLEGRLWKIDLSSSLSGGTASPGQYPLCVLFDAGDPMQNGARIWAPIVTKPAVAVLDPSYPNVYFGTGGDNRAPDTQRYKFYAVRDTDDPGACRTRPISETDLTIKKMEWVVGDGLDNSQAKLPLIGANANKEGAVGDRYWADPLIVNNNSVYFSSLVGNIESVNTCSARQGSKIFAYALTNFYDASRTLQVAGTSLIANTPYLIAAGKVRRSASVRGGNPEGPARPPLNAKQVAPAADVFFQSYTGTPGTGGPMVQRLGTVGSQQVSSPLRVLRWREVVR
jgi:hypothetical protein